MAARTEFNFEKISVINNEIEYLRIASDLERFIGLKV